MVVVVVEMSDSMGAVKYQSQNLSISFVVCSSGKNNFLCVSQIKKKSFEKDWSDVLVSIRFNLSLVGVLLVSVLSI